MHQIIFATNNRHKLIEVKQMLPLGFSLSGMEESGFTDDIPETETTLEGNARLKARYIHRELGCNVMADDTGLEIEALNGAPGVFSARYAGEAKDPTQNMKKVLEKLNAERNRKAQFRTVICLILNDEEYLFEGIVKGSIVEAPQGSAGFGYDPIFVPEGFSETFAQMDGIQKNAISHRGLAVEKMIDFLKNHNSQQ